MSTPDQPDQTPQPGGTPSGPPSYGASQPGQPQPPSQYGAPQAPQYAGPQGGAPGYSAPAQDPGKTMGIIGLVLSILGCLSIVGLILSIVAFNKSKKAGYKNGVALAGIIVGAVMIVASIVVAIVVGTTASGLLEKCEELGPGTHTVDGVTYTCS